MTAYVARPGHHLHAPRSAASIAAAFRYLVATVFLFGAPAHVFFGLWRADAYADMPSPWNPIGEWIWLDVFIPHAQFLALVLAAAELAIAALMFGEGRRGRMGVTCAIGFHLMLLLIFGMVPYTVPVIIGLCMILATMAPRVKTQELRR